MRPLLLALLVLAGCDDMTDQPKKNAYVEARVGPGKVPEGMVERGSRAAGAPEVTLALLARGQERYRIYCVACHSELGDGNGMVVQRGFPAPESFLSARLRGESVAHFYEVIGKGYGTMYSFAYRVAPADRWAIAAYIRALQRSGTVAELSPEQRAGLP